MAAEKNFENKIKNFLKEEGCWEVKYFANAFTPSGIPDILACIGGYFVGIEVKAQNGTPSDLQLDNVAEINKAGGFAFVLYPSAFEEFKKFAIDLKRDYFDRNRIPEIWK